MSGPLFLTILVIGGTLLYKFRAQTLNLWRAVRPAPAVAGAVINPPSAGSTARIITSVMLLIVILTMVGAILMGASITRPKMSSLFQWALGNWLAVLLIWGCAEGLIELGSAYLGQAKYIVQWLLRGAVLLLFVIAGIGSQFETTPEKAHAAAEQAREASARKAAPHWLAVPLASSDTSVWPQVTIPASGRTADIALPIEMHHILVKGTGGKFRLHTVYAGGRDCAFGDSCPDGDVTKYYVVDESGAANTVSYAFVPIGR
jgi:hypothetical protein